MKEYHVGDVVWVARCAPYAEKRVPCPVCFGKREVTLILGNKDTVVLPCENCQLGYDPPTGYVTVREPVVKAERVTIDRVKITETTEGQVREYATNMVTSGAGTTCQILGNDKIFDTEEEALIRATEDAQKMNNENRNPKAKFDRSYTWNAGYHMREAKRLQRQVEYHEKQAVLCKAKAKAKAKVES